MRAFSNGDFVCKVAFETMVGSDKDALHPRLAGGTNGLPRYRPSHHAIFHRYSSDNRNRDDQPACLGFEARPVAERDRFTSPVSSSLLEIQLRIGLTDGLRLPAQTV